MNETVDDQMQVEYRCPCGHAFPVSPETGGTCTRCERTISSPAIQELMSATISFIENSTLGTPINAEHDPVIGTKLGHFEIVQRLGTGGMGAVYRALDCSLQRYVAVKVIRTDDNQAPSKEKIASLLQEAVSQARVNHPNVVTIYYVNHDHQTPFLAMEIMEGSIVDQHGKESIGFGKTIETAIPIVKALEASQSLDIVHGDIKPNNLLVDKLGTVKLSDFGLARRISGNDQEKAGLRGTPKYLAPELMRGEKPTIYSDMYALGITLFELTFGYSPHEIKGRKVKRWLEERENLQIPFPKIWPENVPRYWRDILTRLMQPCVEDRYQDFGELLSDLKAIQPYQQSPAGRLPRLFAWAVDQAVVALVSAIFLLAFGMFTRNIPGPQFYLLAVFLPACLYIGSCSLFGTTIGHFAMQLRTVDKSGLPPTRRRWATREALRSGVFWVFICSSLFAVSQFSFWFTGSIWTIFFVDAISIVFPGILCLHDRLLKTKVVLQLAEDSLSRVPAISAYTIVKSSQINK